MEHHGFFAGIFDFSFSEFVTTKIVKVLYILALILIALGCLIFLAQGLISGSAAHMLLALIVTPIIFFAYLIFTRIWLELIIVVFRIAENVQTLADAKRVEQDGSGVEPPPVG